MNASIIARLGLDAGEMRLGLTAAVKNAQWAHAEMTKAAQQAAKDQTAAAKQSAQELKKLQQQSTENLAQVRARFAPPGGAAGNPRDLSGAMGQATINLTRQVADVGVTAAMGMNPLMILIQQGPQIADAFQMAAMQGLSFSKVLGGLASAALKFAGPAALIVGTVAAVDQLATAYKNLGAANAAARASLDQPLAAASGIDQLAASLAEVRKQTEALADSRGRWATYAGTAASMFTGRDRVLESLRLEAQLRGRQLELSAQIATWIRAEADAHDQIAAGQVREGELALARLETERKIAAAKANTGLGIEGRRAAIDAATREGVRKEDAINQKHDEKERDPTKFNLDQDEHVKEFQRIEDAAKEAEKLWQDFEDFKTNARNDRIDRERSEEKDAAKEAEKLWQDFEGFKTNARNDRIDRERSEEKKKQQTRKDQLDGLKGTLGEVAADAGNPMGARARRAMGYEERARKRALRGDMEGAEKWQARADKIRQGITGLRDDERALQSAMKTALADSPLKDIKAATERMANNLGNAI